MLLFSGIRRVSTSLLSVTPDPLPVLHPQVVWHALLQLQLGEHHRSDYVISAPEVVLAAMAAVTKRISLSSAVTVLSSADPVRVFQNFATLDLISKGIYGYEIFLFCSREI